MLNNIEEARIVEELEMLKFRINNYLEKTNFQNEELFQLSLSIQEYCDTFNYNQLSDRDKKAYDLRINLIQIDNKINQLKESWCK